MPGAYRPLIGNLPELNTYEKEAMKSDEPLAFPLQFLIEYFVGSNYEDHKAVLMNLFGKPLLFITDPDSAQDIFQAKNKYVDKTGDFQAINEDLMPRSFTFQKSTEEWKAKRRAAAHAFVKERIAMMVDVMKGQYEIMIKNWLAEIEASPEKQTEIDIASVFETLLT